jgi:membrane fusion protein (multidrug efflux system)
MASGGSGGAAASARGVLAGGRLRALIIAAVALVLIAGGLWWILSPKSDAFTDDAYVQADKTIVSPKVRGMVVTVAAQENRPVKAGDVLVTIDPQEYDLKIAQAKGDLLAAQAAERAAQAGLARLDAEEKVIQGQVNSAITAAGPQGASNAILRGAFETARNQTMVEARTRGEVEAALAEAKAQEYRANTELQAAQAEKAATSVAAPAAGTVADIQAAVGQMVQPGITLMTIVGNGRPTITANFKETEIGRMHPDQPATVKIDALPGLTFTGKVESLAPGAASQFSLLPFEPGSGNFTKIVQRVPVRIVLDPGQPGLDRLRAGLSAEVTVKLARE